LLLLIIAVIGLFAYGYFTSSLPAPFPALHRTTTPATSTTNPNLLPNARINEPFVYGSVLYTITGVDKKVQVQQGTSIFTASGTFVLVSVTVRDQGQAPVTLQPSSFSLRDSQGREFSLHQAATRAASSVPGKTDLFAEALQPGVDRQAVIVFDVPRADSDFSLRLYSGYVDVSLGQ
jgi:hypothetical protein